MPQQQPEQQNILKQRKVEKAKSVQKIRLILIISTLLIILASIILYAANRKGGISGLIKGDSNALSNTIKNIGDSITGNEKEERKIVVEPLKFFDTPIPSEPTQEPPTEVEKSYIEFTTDGDDYNLTIKKGSNITFKNTTFFPIGLKFSDGRKISLRDGEEKSSTFPKTGTFTYEDELDVNELKITGTIKVID
jgi:hypothetical protein